MIKKIIACMLVVGLTISMVGCGAKKEAVKDNNETTVEDTSKKDDEGKVDEKKDGEDKKGEQQGEENKPAVEAPKTQDNNGGDKKNNEATKSQTPAKPAQPVATKPATSEYVANAPVTSIDTIQISPKHVYYENSKLVMEAYVYNGFSHSVYNINNVAVRLSNNSGVIAEAQFGGLNGAQIGAKNYIVWKFVFDPSAVKMQGADLSYLKTQYQCNNSY